MWIEHQNRAGGLDRSQYLAGGRRVACVAAARRRIELTDHAVQRHPVRLRRSVPFLIENQRGFSTYVERFPRQDGARFGLRDRDLGAAVGRLLHWLACALPGVDPGQIEVRSEEHTSELQSLMRISYAVFCLTKQKNY